MEALPETVLQFGTGKFLRAFADLFIDEANRSGQAVGRVVAVQSTGDSRARLINQQGGRYQVLIRGIENGVTVDRVEEAGSLSRALIAAEQWPEVLEVARTPELRYLICNTAEVGHNLDPGIGPLSAPPRSFPAKLLLVLEARHRAGLPGPTILPCELFEQNADLLRGLLLELTEAWKMPAPFREWLNEECVWHNTLVDRIVVNRPANHPLKGSASDRRRTVRFLGGRDERAHEAKVQIRLVPTRNEFMARFARVPSLLTEAIADAGLAS
jgi:tagaturonate reductase